MDFLSLTTSLFTSQDLIFRLALIVLVALYGLFALIVAIQISNLNKVVNQIGFSSILNFAAVAHFFAAIALLIISVLSL